MALISQSIPNLVNGVSQQPFTLRLSSQAELQENGLSTTSQGLRKRPPTKHLKKILNTTITGAYIHTINRDEIERYVVVITNGDLKIFDLAGNEKTVNFPSGKAYLNAASPANSFRAVTVADYTFIVNNTVTVTQRTSRAPARLKEALINVKAGNYGKEYKIIIDGITRATYTTPDGSLAAHTANISTDFIATQLFNGLSTSLSGLGWALARYGSVIHLQKASGDFEIRAEDGFNNGAMTALKDQIQKFADLPANAGVNGFAVEVIGDKNNGFDDFWVEFDNNGTGAWKETIKPNELLGYTASTMPHTLVRNANGTFTFGPATWKDRTKGTILNNPDPSFVTRKITDVFFYRNRLGFLADEGVIFSEAGEFFNFYRNTVTELLDSDVIDVQASHTKVSSLLHAVPYNRQLLLFSAQTQFVVDSGDLLTPKTISVKQSTEFETNSRTVPVGVGNNIYFAVDKGEYTAVREYFTLDDVTGTNDATEVTSHVPSYIPKNVYKIAAGLNESILAVLSSQERNAIWVYKFFWNNNEKLQSSWSKWTFPAGDLILNADFILSDMFLVIQRSDGVYLEKMSVATGDIGDFEPYNVHLDRKLIVTGNHVTSDGTNSYIGSNWLPGHLTQGEWEAIVTTGQTEKAGIRLPITWDSVNNRAVISGNYANVRLVVGRKYTFRYSFSPITIKVQAGNAQKSDTTGRLQIRTMAINYSDTGYFKTQVTPSGRTTYEYIFSGKTLGLSSATIGQVELETGLFKFPIMSQNTGVDIEVTSDAPLPVSLLSADWEGMYVKRSKGV
jgi:hypothetical protein